MVRLLIFPLLILLSLPTATSTQKTAAEAAISLPTGWIYAPSRLQNAELWRCAAYGGSWVVSSDGGSIKLVRFGAESSKLPPMPPQLKLSKKMIGRRSLQPTSSGWLAGFDAGEFGGGLWWFSHDGSQTIELLSENVHAIHQIKSTILILTGLNHMGLNYGHVYKFNDTPDKAIVTSVADLGGSPEASTVDSGGNIIVATPDSVLQVDKEGKINEMYQSGEHLTYPTSAAVDSNRVVYVAMRFFISAPNSPRSFPVQRRVVNARAMPGLQAGQIHLRLQPKVNRSESNSR